MKRFKKNFPLITGIALREAALLPGMLNTLNEVVKGNEKTRVVYTFPFGAVAKATAEMSSSAVSWIRFDDEDLTPFNENPVAWYVGALNKIDFSGTDHIVIIGDEGSVKDSLLAVTHENKTINAQLKALKPGTVARVVSRRTAKNHRPREVKIVPFFDYERAIPVKVAA